MSITAADIQEFRVVEDGHHDFKEQVDLEKAKAKFIDEVIAFLNVGHGHLLIGVKEDKTRFAGWGPNALPDGDIDAYARKIQSIVQSSIDPVPTNIKVHEIEREGGSVVHVEIGEHRMQPYQNKLTGGFVIRTDKQNRIIRRDEIQAHFVEFARYKTELFSRMQAEKDALARRDLMAKDGPILTIGILPRERFGSHPRLSIRDGLVLTNGPAFPHHGHHRSEIFKGCPGGAEAPRPEKGFPETSRFFVADDWFMQGTIVHPFSVGPHERITIHEMKRLLEAYFQDIADLLADADVRGPFAIAFEFANLHANEKLQWFFQDKGPITHSPHGLLEKFEPGVLAEEAYQAIYRVSRYG